MDIKEFIKDTYLKKGFGAMNKNDFEVFIFNEIMKYPYDVLNINKPNLQEGQKLPKPSNYTLSIALQIPESKVKRLAYEADLKYGADNREAECKEKLLEALEKVKFSCEKGDNTKASFIIEEVSIRKYLEHKLKINGDFVDYHNNKEIICVGVKEFTELIEGCYDEDEKKAVLKKLNKEARVDFKSVLQEILISVAKQYVGNTIPLAGKALVNLVDELKNKKQL